MSFSIIAAVAMASVVIYLGLYHILIYRQRPEARENLFFAFCCLTVGLYDIFCSGLYGSVSPQEGVFWQRGQVIALGLIGISFVWLIRHLADSEGGPWPLAITWAWLPLLAITLFEGRGLVWTNIPDIKAIPLPWDGTLVYNEMAAGPLIIVFWVFFSAFFIYAFAMGLRLYRRGVISRAKPLLLGTLMCLAGFVNDWLASSGVFHSVYIIEYAFLVQVLVVSYWLSNQVVQASLVEDHIHREMERYRVLVEDSPLGISLIADGGEYEYLNPRFTDIFGYTLRDIPSGKAWFEKAFPDAGLRRSVISHWRRAHARFTEGESLPTTYEVVCKDGSKKTIHFRPVSLAGGKQFVVYEDITQRTRTEKALKESESKFAKAFHSSPDWLSITTLTEGRYLDVNEAFCRGTGHRREEILGRTAAEIGLWAGAAERSSSVEEILGEGSIQKKEIVIRHKNGSEIIVLWSAEKIVLEGEQCHLSVVQDITAHKRAEAELLRTNQTLKALIQDSPLGVVTLDSRGSVTMWEGAAEKLSGYTSEETLGRVLPIALPEDKEEFLRRLGEAFAGGSVVRKEMKLRRKDEELIDVRITAAPIHNVQGQVMGFMGLLEDITEQRLAEFELGEREKWYRTTFEHTGTAMMVNGPGTLINMVNETFVELSGYRREEIEGKKNLEEFVEPSDLQRMLDYHQEQHAAGWAPTQYEFTFIGREGGNKRILNTVKRIPGTCFLVNSLIDISERNKAEMALRRSEEQHRTFLENLPDPCVVYDLEGLVMYVNKLFEEQFGWQRHELMGRRLDFVPPGAIAETMKNIARIRRGERVHSFITQRRTKEGRNLDMEVNTSPLFGSNGEKTGNVVILRDISELIAAEKDLRESEQRNRSLVENVPYGLFIATVPAGSFLFLNQRICQVFGYSLEEALKFTVWDLTEESEHQRMRRKLLDYAERREADPGLVVTGRKKDGTPIRIHVRYSMVTYQGEPAVQGYVRDVTETEMLQRQLQQSQKMQAMGTLAGGVAHEFNNILMTIRGYTQLLVTRASMEPKVKEYLRKIEDGTKRGSNLTKTMLSFARLESGDRELLEVNRLLEVVIDLIGQAMTPDIELVRELHPGTPPVMINPTQLEQVLLNLAVNARDAMPQGGLITFRSCPCPAGEDFVHKNSWSKEKMYARITVEDNGCGMDPKVLPRVFEPFFTTKEPGKGTGLGLSVAYSMIQSQGGHIEAENRKRGGSRFTIYLPAAPKEPVSLPVQKVKPDLSKGRGQHLLVVDDEDSVREITREALEAFGYLVSEAHNGEAALHLYQEALSGQNPFEMVILDLAMPVMDGRECLRRLLQIDPEVRVFISTGHSEDQIALGDLAGAPVGILRKPYDLTSLLDKVGSLLVNTSLP